MNMLADHTPDQRINSSDYGVEVQNPGLENLLPGCRPTIGESKPLRSPQRARSVQVRSRRDPLPRMFSRFVIVAFR